MVTILMILLWDLCGIISAIWQKRIYDGIRPIPVLMHIVAGPCGLLATLFVDYLKVIK